MKAIHNNCWGLLLYRATVVNKAKIQNESNSQLYSCIRNKPITVVNKAKIQNESNSQQHHTNTEQILNCC